MTTVATAMLKAALQSGLISQSKIKKDGTMKKSPRTNKCWPRLQRNQSKFSVKIVA